MGFDLSVFLLLARHSSSEFGSALASFVGSRTLPSGHRTEPCELLLSLLSSFLFNDLEIPVSNEPYSCQPEGKESVGN